MQKTAATGTGGGPADPAFAHHASWNAAVRNEDFQTALREVNRALTLLPDDPYYLSLRGMTYYRLADFAKAHVDLRAALTRNPLQKEAIDLLSEMRKVAVGHRDRARKLPREESVQELDKAIALAPDDPDFYAFRGVTLGQLGDYRRSMSDIKRTLELNPQYKDAKEVLQALEYIAQNSGTSTRAEAAESPGNA